MPAWFARNIVLGAILCRCMTFEISAMSNFLTPSDGSIVPSGIVSPAASMVR